MSFVRKGIFAAVFLSATALSTYSGSAETILGALSKAYQNNSTLNSGRAGVRVTDESVAIAKSGYRPTVTGVGNFSYTSNNGTRITASSFAVQLNQTLFDGFQTYNNVQGAESQVFAANENLRNSEMNTLFGAAQAYMDVIRDRQIAVLREQNLKFLDEQVRAARSRLEVGEGTRTDVAQVEAALSNGQAQLAAARAQVAVSEATYRQIVGDQPGKLNAASPLAKMLPKSLDQAYAVASARHPAILANQHLVDSAGFAVKSAEGQLLPQLSGSASMSRNFQESHGINPNTGLPGVSNQSYNAAQIGATLTVPIYQGGRVSAQVRQNKESLGQARIQVDVARDQVRAAVASAWSAYNSAREGVVANRTAISAAQLALNGVIEERNVGQRTTLDVLTSQQDVITAQINLANSQNQLVVASYGILQATGQLYASRLGLQVAEYKPEEHYKAVKDKWFGLRTPDGR
ncbi:outer membrane protein [Pseudaminobacter salicylatoxidans]|uniref:Outer membrane protein n=1 Tax=Pseudaminobacter salicylatoxidans TaxID=93369 RepID=A0A316CSK0_PSESE|nr:TolC family outer membrane protein [Pseudaminobacter salicylatoxidans]PWJ85154.1 outer membrane protein [Pseudaminobacter salicylatoxidans]